MAKEIIDLAWQQFRLGRTSDAEMHCVDVLTHSGDEPGALFLLASIWERRGQYAEAVALLRRAIASSPSVAEYHLNLGAILGRLGYFDDSVAALREAVRLRPDYACDTAAVLASLDLLITSDTSIAHLAGALGVPVWVALAHVPDWRWMLDRQDSPWYPTMRLFRQARPGDWNEVFERITASLASLSDSRYVERSPETSVLISPGELADRLTILRLKCDRLNTTAAIVPRSLQHDLSKLEEAWQERASTSQPLLDTLVFALARVNEDLWNVEDELRGCELRMEFDNRFVELARSVYRLNDHRSQLKGRIDRLLGSTRVETKLYMRSPRTSPRTKAQEGLAPSDPSIGDALKAAVGAVEAGRYAEAEVICRRIIKHDPGNARANHLIGLAAHKAGDQPTAIEWMRRSIVLDPSIPAFHNNLGEALRLSDLLIEALASYREAVRIKPEFAEAHWHRPSLPGRYACGIEVQPARRGTQPE